MKFRNVLTARSSRSISLSSIFTACCPSGSIGKFAFKTSSHSRIELRGFFTSWATPAVTRPIAASRSDTWSWVPILSSVSTSCNVTSVPIRSPCSRITCALAPTRRIPVAPSSTASFPSAGSISSPSIRRALRNGWPAGKISLTRRPRNSSDDFPRNFSTEGLTRTARPFAR